MAFIPSIINRVVCLQYRVGQRQTETSGGGFILLSCELGSLGQFLNHKRDKYVEICVIDTEKDLADLKKSLNLKKIPFKITTFQEFDINSDGEKKSVAGRLYAPKEFKETVLSIISREETRF